MLPLDQLFEQFLRERIYLKNVSPKPRIWYETAWKAFRAIDSAPGPLTKSRLQAFIVQLRDRNLSPISCNTYMTAINTFCCWLHVEGHCEQRLHLTPLKTSRRLLQTLDTRTLRLLLGFKPRDFRQSRIFTLVGSRSSSREAQNAEIRSMIESADATTP